MFIHLRSTPITTTQANIQDFHYPRKRPPLRWHCHPRSTYSSDYWNFLKEKSPHGLICTMENTCQPRGHQRVFAVAPPEACEGQGLCKALFPFSVQFAGFSKHSVTSSQSFYHQGQNQSVIVWFLKAGSLFEWSHQMLLVGPSEMWAELLLQVQIYSFASLGKDLIITQHQHLLAREDRVSRRAQVGNILGLPSTPTLLRSRNAQGGWDSTFDSLGNLGLSFPMCNIGTSGLFISNKVIQNLRYHQVQKSSELGSNF